ncbi:MAG: hypothetical protein QMC43_01385 [Candidatus Poseidoniaceae archaeon]
MHIASKITLLIGVVMLIGSVIGMVAGIGGLVDAGEDRTYLEDESSGTFTVNENESWVIEVYIIHPVDCESVELTIVDSRGDDVIGYKYECSDDNYYEDDEMYEYAEGERQIFASINHEQSGMEYTLNSNTAVDIYGTYCGDACIESAIGGGFTALGGFVGICCSVPLLILGLILALTLDDNKISSTMQSGQMTTGQVAYQTPVSGQVTYQTPVAGQAPMAQNFNPTPVSQVIQPSAVPVTPITPPLAQQPPVEQVTQPVAVPVTPITPPLTQQPSVGQETQPEKSAWWGEEPQQ